MAGSQSFGKRENEKKKRARRLEKQKRREERQAGGPSSFEEMIAYVDENGRIADTLPEKSGREEVRPEDVPIATPKRESSVPEMLTGRVEHFNESRGIRFYQGYGIFREIFLSRFVGSPRTLPRAISSLSERKEEPGE